MAISSRNDSVVPLCCWAAGRVLTLLHFSLAETTLRKAASSPVPLKIPVFEEFIGSCLFGSIAWCHGEQEQRFSAWCSRLPSTDICRAGSAGEEQLSWEQRAGIPQGCAGRLEPARV